MNPENLINFILLSLKSDSLIIWKTGKGFVTLPICDYLLNNVKGDDALKIAIRYRLDITTFTELNKISHNAKLKVGDVVLIEWKEF